ncbi:MAG: Na(+)-translocating NADH-quinone reductase subunit A [Saccharospirillaceae bacterium]|nr:Na(+)-translocating NADH-quinone reductase subunit A [Pseudomonadales bacterium]NRB80534.1 Na(+)-translocating NADH-quinone reductase subunit A [Saccharospirillaceae bacterium]
MIKIKKGLDLPLAGAPEQQISDGQLVKTVAVVGFDYHGMKPSMKVKAGDTVKKGQVLFADKKNEGVVFTAPASGLVSAVNRGAKRIFQSVVIEKQGDEQEIFAKYDLSAIAELSVDQITENLVNSGLWTTLRTRPYSKIPAIGSNPAAIFITAMDTNPGALDAQVVVTQEKEAFALGQTILAKLTQGKTYLCVAANSTIEAASGVQLESFTGVHPAGNVGTHIHFLEGVSAQKTVWTINFQDVIAVAKLFTTGELNTDRVVALSGPQVSNPRLVRTQVGACLSELLAGETKEGNNRVVTGSVFGGRTASDVSDFLGRYHTQVTVLEEGGERTILHYLRPGFDVISILNIYISKLFKGKKYNFTTSRNGSERAMMPVGNFEKIMPLDILATQLLRAIAVGDLEMAEKLGALELDEDDLALCTFTCAGKYEYGQILRNTLTRIEAEG